MRKVSAIFIATAGLMFAAPALAYVDNGLEAARPVKQAEIQFMRTFSKIVANHPLAGDLQDARQQYTKAYRKVDLVRREIKTAVESRADVHQLDLQIRTLRESIRPSDTMDRRTEVAGQILAIRKLKTKLITEASDASDDLTFALSDLDDAVRHLREVQDQYDMILRTDPTFTAARDQLASARKSIPTISYAMGG